MMHTATRARPTIALAVLGLLLLPAAAGAQQTRDATVGLVLQPLTQPISSCTQINPRGCSDTDNETTGNLFEEYYALLCVFGGDPDIGIGGLQLGVDYDGGTQSGVDILNWTLCADLEWRDGEWPAARTGNVITWDGLDNCQKNVPGDPEDGITAVAGYFYLIAYSTDRLSVVPRPNPNRPFLEVAECNPPAQYTLDPAKQAGSLGFSSNGGEKGTLPCLRRVAEDTTWGRIKSTYGNGP